MSAIKFKYFLEETHMKKNMATRLAVLMMALVMVFALFSGCADKAADNADTQSSNSSDDTAADSTATDAPADTATDAPADAFVIGISQIVDHPSLNVCRQGAIDKLAELGYVEGENLVINYQDAQGEMAIATTIAQQFVTDKVDLVLAIATPTAQAAYAAAIETDIPIVFSAVSAPIEAALANEDGSNLVGVTGTSDELPVDATFQLIQALVPGAVKIGILHNTSEVNSDVQLAQAKELAPAYGMEIVDVGISSTNEIASALDSLLPQVDVVMNLTDNMVVSSMPLVVQKCNEAMIPLFGSEDTQVSAGALASAGVDYYALGQLTGEMIASILGGTPAQDIALAKLTEPMLIVNTDQVELLGMTVPDSLTVEYVSTKEAE
jgi:putative ABC transport system substrate-binding protein